MTDQRWQKVEDIFHRALELAAEVRPAFLDQACGGDESLRKEVESLLAHESDNGSTFAHPAADGPPQTIAHYRITSKLGQGGMGAVYRATDTKLGREVAIKVLPPAFADDADRLARFTREAKVLASLNHPNIAQIYGVEESNGVGALVMELVPGKTLGAHIKSGPLPVDTALNYAKQIADALEAAHEKGFTHRDLKPANIMVTPEGVVKVLDFGLAAVSQASAPGEASPTNSPTLTMRATQAGTIMGTAAYMSPEQASGKPVDRRADIWSFGVVLFEMLTGRRLFHGETISHTLAGVLNGPIDFNTLPPQTPGKIRDLLKRCLERNVRNRLQAVGDARIVIEEVLSGSSPEPGPVAVPQRRSLMPWGLTAAAVLASALLAFGWWRATRPVDLPLTRLSVDLGKDALTGLNLTAAISPDGRRLVFPARAPNGKQQLATRLLDQTQTTLLPGTEGGATPFFSPDSQWIGFFGDGKLKKISVQGGAPVALCDAADDLGASWGEDGMIIAALSLQSGLSRVSAAGGNPQPLTKLAHGEITHRWPQILPGGEAVLFTSSPTNIGMENASVAAISLKSGVTKTVVAGGYFGRYLPGNGTHGYLLYLNQDVVLGVAFDPVRLEVQGTPKPLLEDVAATPLGGGQFDFSAAPSGHGTLVHLAGKVPAQAWPVVWLDSSGKMQPLIPTPGAYAYPRFSPDGRRLAVQMSTSGGTGIYVYELGRDTITRLTFTGNESVPVWTPDGKHIAFQTSTASGFGIWWIRSDGSGEPQQILATQNNVIPGSFSPDGRHLVYREFKSETGYDILTLPLDASDPDHPKPGKPETFLATPSNENVPMFSPDGRWIAYRSNESGTNEIYVRPFPAGPGGKWLISTGGGLYGIWSNDGRELFYETADNRIMVVDYTVNGDSFEPGKPRLWSGKQILYSGNSNLDLAPDGKRFAVFPIPQATGSEEGSVHVAFLLNFFDELRRRIPEGW